MTLQYPACRTFLPLLAIVFLLMLGGCAQQAEPDRTAQGHLSKAQALIRQGDFDAAYHHLNRAMALSPSDPAVRLNLGWLYLYTGSPEKARSELVIVKKAWPDSPATHYLAGALYARLDQHADALEQYRKAMAMGETVTGYFEQGPTAYVDIYFDTAQSLIALNEYDKAVAMLEKGLALAPQGDAGMRTNFLFAICNAYYRQKDLDKAFSYCSQAVDMSPDPEEKDRINSFLNNLKLVQMLDEETGDLPQEPEDLPPDSEPEIGAE